MKKYLLTSILFLGIMFLMTGCGNERDLTCSIDLENVKLEFLFHYDDKGQPVQNYEYNAFMNDSLVYIDLDENVVPYAIKDRNNLEIGYLVGFKSSDDNIYVHRIIDKVENDGNDYFITKGDNYSTQDNDLLAVSSVLFQAKEIDKLQNLSYNEVKKSFKNIGYSCS